MKVAPVSTSAQSDQSSDTASQSQAGTNSANLRGLSYAEGVAQLAPEENSSAQQKTSKDETSGDNAAPKISRRKAQKRLEVLLDASNAPLSNDAVTEARAMIERLSKKGQVPWKQKLETRIASGESEAQLGTLLNELDGPISADSISEAGKLLQLIAENRRPQWTQRLADTEAWGRAETDVAQIVDGQPGVLADSDVAHVEALIANLPQTRQGKWSSALQLRVANDPIEAKLEATLADTNTRLSQAQHDTLKGLISQLSNGKGGEWTTRLNDRLSADTAAVFEGDEATRSEALSTLSADEVSARANSKETRRGKHKGTDKRTRVRFDPESEVSVSTLKELRNGDYAANVEALVAGRSEQLNLSQKALITKAKEFLAKEPAPKGERAGYSELTVPSSMAASPDLILDAGLITRMKRFTRFAAWAGLIAGKPIVNDGVRSPARAHTLSMRYMFTSGVGLGGAGNRKTLAEWAIKNNGKAPDHQWIPTHLVKKLKDADGDDAIYKKVLVDEMKTNVTRQEGQASEGYPKGDVRRIPNMRNPGVSLHCSGQAMDVTYSWVFSSSYDPMIDLLAAYFGLWRPVKDSSSSPEDWHYEKLGSVVTSDASAE